MNTNKILIALLFLIAFVLLVVALFYPTFIDHGAEPVEEEVVVPITTETEGDSETKIWATSREHFVIETPADWDVEQGDSGGKSLISFTDDFSIELGLSSTFEGTPITLDTWVNEKLIDADKIEACDATSFGGETAQCFLVTTRNETLKEYFGVADTLTYFLVSIALEPDTEVSGALGTLNFNPTEIDLENATIIP